MVKKIFLKSKFKLITLFIIHLILESCSLLLPIQLSKFIDSVMYNNKTHNMTYYIIFIILIVILQVILYYVLTIMSTVVNNTLATDLKKDILSHILHTPKRAMDMGQASYYTRRIDQDSKQVINFFSNDTMTMLINIFKLIIMITYLFQLNGRITVVLIVLSILNMCMYFVFKAKISEKYRVYLESENGFYSFQNNCVFSKNSISRKSLYNSFMDKYEDLFTNSLGKLLKYTSTSTLYNSICQVIRFICLIIIIILGGTQIINGTMTIGNFTLFNNYYNRLLDTLSFFTGYLKRYQDNKVSCERLCELTKIPILFNGAIKINCIENISIKNLSLLLNDKVLLDNLNLQFQKGNIYIIQGRNGIGKSTFFDILLGIEQEYEGKIYYNNKDISTIDLIELRKNNISICEQNQDLIIDKELNMDDNILTELTGDFIDISIIDKLNSKNQFIEQGSSISGGEKQKISLVQALSKKSDLLLLDEPTNALDSKSIRILKNKLLQIKTNKIIIIITHNNELNDICDYNISFTNTNNNVFLA